jgi:hypothetical protein
MIKVDRKVDPEARFGFSRSDNMTAANATNTKKGEPTQYS